MFFRLVGPKWHLDQIFCIITINCNYISIRCQKFEQKWFILQKVTLLSKNSSKNHILDHSSEPVHNKTMVCIFFLCILTISIILDQNWNFEKKIRKFPIVLRLNVSLVIIFFIRFQDGQKDAHFERIAYFPKSNTSKIL
jgi:hypothetical protein